MTGKKYRYFLIGLCTIGLIGLSSIFLSLAMSGYVAKEKNFSLDSSNFANEGTELGYGYLEGETPYIFSKDMVFEVKKEMKFKGYPCQFGYVTDEITGQIYSDEERTGDIGFQKVMKKVIRLMDGPLNLLALYKDSVGELEVSSYIGEYRDNLAIIDNRFYGKMNRYYHVIVKEKSENYSILEIILEPDTGEIKNVMLRQPDWRWDEENKKVKDFSKQTLNKQMLRNNIIEILKENFDKDLEPSSIQLDISEFDLGYVIMEGKLRSGEDVRIEYDAVLEEVINYVEDYVY